MRSGFFHVLPEAGLQALEELFRARVITFLVEKGLLPPAVDRFFPARASPSRLGAINKH